MSKLFGMGLRMKSYEIKLFGEDDLNCKGRVTKAFLDAFFKQFEDINESIIFQIEDDDDCGVFTLFDKVGQGNIQIKDFDDKGTD